MILTALLMLTLTAPPAAAAPPPAPAIRAQEKSAQADPLDAEFEKLMKEAEQASGDYAEKRKTDPKTPRWEIGMWSKFEELADKGHGRSLLWLAQNAHRKFEGKSEITAKKLELYGKLIEKFGSADWSDRIVGYVVNEKKFFGMQEMDKLLSQLKSTSKNTEAQAAALDALSNILTGTSASDSDRKRASEYKDELVKNFQDSKVVSRMNAKAFREQNLVVGKPVPDFAAKDIEGADFKLSDYKGKVVLIDFWGFW
jgi:hypothetical protein